METSKTPKEVLLSIYHAALKRVNGRSTVANWLRHQCDLKNVTWNVVAIGKAASAMALGARDGLGNECGSVLVITKKEYLDTEIALDPAVTVCIAEHPLPGEGSLNAGRTLIDFIEATPINAHLLFLISGGSSSMIEIPIDGVDLDLIRRVNAWLLGSGLSIEDVNRVRQRLSNLKGGRLRQYLRGRPAIALLISDVLSNDIRVIGSGILSEELKGLPDGLPSWVTNHLKAGSISDSIPQIIPHYIIASLRDALEAAEESALGFGLNSHCFFDLLTGNAESVGYQLATEIKSGFQGVSIWGGETTVSLPENPGIGGRNQQLALAAAIALDGHDDCWLLSAGTDGQDGSSEYAGAIINGHTIIRGRRSGLSPEDCLHKADAERFLKVSGDLIYTGPTETNVADLFIGLSLDAQNYKGSK